MDEEEKRQHNIDSPIVLNIFYD